MFPLMPHTEWKINLHPFRSTSVSISYILHTICSSKCKQIFYNINIYELENQLCRFRFSFFFLTKLQSCCLVMYLCLYFVYHDDVIFIQQQVCLIDMTVCSLSAYRSPHVTQQMEERPVGAASLCFSERSSRWRQKRR